MDEYIRDVGEMKYQQGRRDEKIATVRRLNRIHCDPEKIALYVGSDLETVEKWIKEINNEN